MKDFKAKDQTMKKMSQCKIIIKHTYFKNLKLTIIDSIAQIAFPSTLINEGYKRVDICSTRSAPHNGI